MTNDELVSYYKKLLILQYKNLEKAPKHIEALVKSQIIFELIEDIKNGFDIDNAVGVQQDIIGKYLGIDRIIDGIPFNQDYFGYMRYGEDPDYSIFTGYMRYGDVVPDVRFFRYGESETVLTLTDVDFRKLLRFRVIQANSYHSLQAIDDALYEFFGNDIVLIDNEDMTVTYRFPSTDSKLVTILQSEDLIPRPMGVKIIIDLV